MRNKQKKEGGRLFGGLGANMTTALILQNGL